MTTQGKDLSMIGRHDKDSTVDGSDRVDTDRSDTDRSDTDRVDTDRPVAGRHSTDATGTHTGADVHDRMTGTDRTDRSTTYTDAEHRVVPEKLKPAKTSAAAVFGLVFGLAALFCALTAILSPAAVLFGLIGIVLSIVGMKMAKRLGITGKGVAIGGLVTSILGLLLGGAVLAGAAALVNDPARLDQLENSIEDLRDDVPPVGELTDEIPTG